MSPRQLPHSHAFSRVINAGDASPSKIPGPPVIKIIVKNVDTVRNLVGEKTDLPIPTFNSLLELVNNVERYAASLDKDQISTAVNDILPRAQACIESDGGAFEYKLKSFKKILNH